MLIKMNLDDFSKEIASSKPTPGGGSVSAYGAAMAAALFEMAMRVSYQNTPANLQQYTSLLEPIRNESLALVEEDSLAFMEVMAAYGLAKTSEEEKAKRKIQIQKALQNATRVPLKTAHCCVSLMKVATELATISKESCVSDVAVAFHFAQAGFKGAIYNVAINLATIKDNDFSQSVKQEVQELEKWYNENTVQIEILMRERLGMADSE